MSKTTKPIVVIEDDEDIRSFLVELLSSEGYSVVSTEDASAALEVLIDKKLVPFLILTDRMMPLLDGNEFLKRLKSIPSTSKVPTVMLSATQQPEPKMAEHFFKKPFDLHALLEVVHFYGNAADDLPARTAS